MVASRRFLTALTLAALFCVSGDFSGAGAQSEPKPQWFSSVDDAGSIANWGIPETDAVGFVVRCTEPGRVELSPALYAMEAPSVVPDIEFSVDGDRYVRTAKLVFSERDAAWQAAAVLNRDDALIDALRRGRTLTYDFYPSLREGDAFTMSLSGSAKAIDAVLDGC